LFGIGPVCGDDRQIFVLGRTDDVDRQVGFYFEAQQQARRDDFGVLRSALRQLYPELEGGLPTARQLGYTLRSLSGRVAVGRTIVQAKKNTRGDVGGARAIDQRSGALHRRPGKRLKSRSVVIHSQPDSIASAAR
jgi:hypothetical protein